MQEKNLSDIYKWLWIVLIILAVFLGVKTLGSLIDLRDTDPAYNSITISGEGEVISVPDLATFSFTVSADKSTVSAAQEDVKTRMDKILAALKDFGIEEKDIKTTDYSVWPKYRYETTRSYPCTPYSCPPSGNQVADGYTANHSVTIKVRDTEKAGLALAIAGDNGATNISSITFTIDDPEKLTNDARALAIADAREKAKILTKNLGVRLVRVVSYSDSTDGGIIPYYREAAGMGGTDMAVAPAKAPSLPTGENKIKVVVNVTYEIR